MRSGTLLVTVGILLTGLWWESPAAELHVGASQRYTTIQAALDAAQPGDRLVIHGGVYREGNLIVDKPLTITGLDFPEIDGEGRFEVFTVVSDRVTMTGLTISRSGVSYTQENAAVKIKESVECVIAGNRFVGNFFAVYLSRSNRCRIVGNTIVSSGERESSTGNGIHLWSSNDTVIEDNTIEGHRDGIYFEFARRGFIRRNQSIRNMRYGLHFMFSDSCQYQHNVFRENGAGVAVMYSRRVEMTNNAFEDNWGSASYGLLLKDITDSRLEDNRFRGNTVALHSEGSIRLSIRQNEFVHNGWAVKIMANSTENVFESNNFIGNSFDVATNSRQNPNRFRRNYWSAYGGYDLGRDGVGDVGHRPVRLFSLVVEQFPASLILLRSFFIDLLDVAERVFPVLTPETLVDPEPLMRPWMS